MKVFRDEIHVAKTVGVSPKDIVTATQAGRRLGFTGYGPIYGRGRNGQIPRYKTRKGWRFYVPHGCVSNDENGNVITIPPPCGGLHIYTDEEADQRHPRAKESPKTEPEAAPASAEEDDSNGYASMSKRELIAELVAANACIVGLEGQVLRYYNDGGQEEKLKNRIATLESLHDDAVEEVVFAAKEAGVDIDYSDEMLLVDAVDALLKGVDRLKGLSGIAEEKLEGAIRKNKELFLDLKIEKKSVAALEVVVKGLERDRLEKAKAITSLDEKLESAKDLIEDAISRAELYCAQRDDMREKWVAAKRENVDLKQRVLELESESYRSLAGKAVSRVAGAFLARGGKK